MEYEKIIALRMERQHITEPIDDYEKYKQFFRLIQPVSPVFFSEPGSPPSLVHRTTFNDEKFTDTLRSRRELIKGRFQNGNVGYIFSNDFELYIAAYKKDIINLTYEEQIIYNILRNEGPVTIHQLKELTGMLAKEITPILHKLSLAFMVYEDQVDSDWERGWYLFESEWPEVNINRYTKQEAIAKLIKNTLYLLVYGNTQHIKGWLRLPTKDIKEAIQKLLSCEEIVEMDGGYLLKEDLSLLQRYNGKVPQGVFVLHRSDFLVKAYEHELKEKFKKEEILQYILIDGKFQGAVCGHWRIGPHDVDNIVLLIDESEKKNRKEEIIEAVSKFYHPPFSNIKHYDGVTL